MAGNVEADVEKLLVRRWTATWRSYELLGNAGAVNVGQIMETWASVGVVTTMEWGSLDVVTSGRKFEWTRGANHSGQDAAKCATKRSMRHCDSG